MGSNCNNGSHGFALNYNRGDGIKQGKGFLDQSFLSEAMDLVRGNGTFLN